MSRIAMVDGVLMRLHSVEVVSLEEAEKLAAELREDLAHLEVLIAEARQRLEPQGSETAAAAVEEATPPAEPEQPVAQPAAPAADVPPAPAEPAAPEQPTPTETPVDQPVVLQ